MSLEQKIKELREKRGKIVEEMRGILKRAEDAKQDLTAEEEANYDKAFRDQESIGKQVERLERQVALDKEMNTSQRAGVRPDPNDGAGDGNGDPDNRAAATPPETREAFRRFLRGGVNTLSAAELRGLQAGSDTEGGYIVAPQEFVQTLLKKVDDAVIMRRRATVYTIPKAASLGVPSLDVDMNDADWTTELATGAQDDAMRLGKRELRCHPFAKRVKISKTLLRMAVMDPEALVRDRMAYKFGVTEEKAYLNGDGVQKPLGIFVASPDGINTDRDVSTGNTATSIGFDGLIEAKFTLKPQYWNKASWIFHRDGIKQISKLKDLEGRYIWVPSVIGGTPNRILDLPYEMSEFAPNTFTASKYVGILGDFSFYWIVDALDMQIQTLMELYAETNQIGLIGRKEGDGMPVLSEAFIRVQLAAS